MVADSVRAFEDMAVRFLMPLTLHHSSPPTPTPTTSTTTIPTYAYTASPISTTTNEYISVESISSKGVMHKGSSPLECISTHIQQLGRNKADLFNTTNNVAIFIYAMLATHEIKHLLLHSTTNSTKITRPQRIIPHNSDPSKLTMSEKSANLSVLARNQVNFPHIVIIQ